MDTLRVYLDAAPDAGRDAEWTLFDAADRAVRSGRGRRPDWPAADAVDAVIAAALGRLVTLTLPPLPAARAASAVAFALEDQLAGAPEDSHIALGPQAADGKLRVAIISDAWMRAFNAASARSGIRWRRIVLESDLAQPPAAGWCWCAAAADRPGFLRTSDGATLAVGPATGTAPPEELVLAVNGGRAQRPVRVRADVAGATPELLTQAKAATGVEFVAGTPWRWSAASADAWQAAINLQTAQDASAAAAARVDVQRLLRPALWIAACALGIHVLASVGQWSWLSWQSLQVQRELASLAQTAAPEEAASAAPAVAIARRDAQLRHRAGLIADDDALPLLARAAPAMASLPAGTIRSLRFADGHVVFELQKLDASQPARVQRDLQQAGLVTIAAPVASGVRLRVGLD
jgi:general secretion pathway protein L